MPPGTKSNPKVCASCKRNITGVKLVIKELWHCQECAYYLDQGRIPPGAERDR